MLLCTNYNNEECEWKEMVLDEVEVAFRYDFTVHISGAYFFMTCFKQYIFIFLFILFIDMMKIIYNRNKKDLLFVLLYKMRWLFLFFNYFQIKIKNTCIGSSGLCIQTILSSSIRSLSYFEKILIDSYLVFLILFNYRIVWI